MRFLTFFLCAIITTPVLAQSWAERRWPERPCEGAASSTRACSLYIMKGRLERGQSVVVDREPYRALPLAQFVAGEHAATLARAYQRDANVSGTMNLFADITWLAGVYTNLFARPAADNGPRPMSPTGVKLVIAGLSL